MWEDTDQTQIERDLGVDSKATSLSVHRIAQRFQPSRLIRKRRNYVMTALALAHGPGPAQSCSYPISFAKRVAISF
jgi:hypothetical protein